MNIKRQLKHIEKAQADLAEKKRLLMDQEKELARLNTKLEELFKQSGYSSPKDLIEALAKKYRIKSYLPAPLRKRRKRTRITAELRDTIRRDIESGTSMNAVSKQYIISYAVVVKIMRGAYDHL